MRPETETFIRDEWIPALRSGKFPQSHRALKVLNNDGTVYGYCCLGVVCELMNAQEVATENMGGYAREKVVFEYTPSDQTAFDRHPSKVDRWQNSGVLPPSLAHELGMTSDGKFFPAYKDERADMPVCTLVELNDYAGWSFNEIADFLENFILNPDEPYQLASRETNS